MQIFEATNKRDAQMLLIVAMFYIIGSVMFLVPSVPYLFDFDTTDDKNKIHTFLAAIYICGSVCFTVGGIINFCRSRTFEELEETLGISDDPEKARREYEPPFPSDESTEKTA